MRNIPLASCLVALGLAGAASATDLDLVWTGTTGTGATGGRIISVSTTTAETLTLDVILDIDSQGLSSTFFSLEFDGDLSDELDVLSFAELAWNTPGPSVDALSPLTAGLRSSQESSSGSEGQLFTFEGIHSPGPGPGGLTNVTLAYARVVFATNPGNIANDGFDVVAGAFGPDGGGGDDGTFDATAALADITNAVGYGSAAVMASAPVPSLSPWSIGLLAGALLCTAALVRRSRP